MSRYNPFEERRKNERINRLVKENIELKSKVDKLEQDYASKRLYADLMEQAVKFAQSQTQELQEQNAELVEALESVVKLQDKYFGERDIHRVLQKKVFEIEELLTKYNHLNQM